MERKTFEAEIKRFTGEGKGSAVLARLGVRDRDGDVLLRGLLAGEQQAPLIQSHQWQLPPIGRAAVREQGDEMVADFALNLDTAGGREWASVLKFDLAGPRGPLQQWSWAFTVLPGGAESGMHEGQPVRFLKRIVLHEVSPVLVAASVGSRTVALKGDALDQEAIRAMEARMRERAVVFHGLMALALPPPGSIGYKALPHHEVREYRALAASFVAEACAQLRTPMAAAVEVIRPARDGERADFSYEKEIGGCAGLSDRTIYVVHDLDSRALAQVCGHEAFHLAHQGGSEQEAERFGRAFRQSARGPSGPVTGRPGSKEHYEESSSVRASSPGWDRLVAAAQFVRSGI